MHGSMYDVQDYLVEPCELEGIHTALVVGARTQRKKAVSSLPYLLVVATLDFLSIQTSDNYFIFISCFVLFFTFFNLVLS